MVSAEIHCVTAVAWFVSGVSNPDFPNFTKHSTVLTSILQQINTLYQHFQSAKTAIPALEQAKTMLKIALPTFKNDENHTKNSVCEVRCGECGGGFLHFGCQYGEMVVRLRRFLCVIQAVARLICGENAVRKRQKCGTEMAKLWYIFGVYMLYFLYFGCQCGEMVVRLRRLVVWFRLKFIVLRRLRGAFRAFPILISRISQSIPPFSPPFYSKSTPYINISNLPKPPYRHSNRRKQC